MTVPEGLKMMSRSANQGETMFQRTGRPPNSSLVNIQRIWQAALHKDCTADTTLSPTNENKVMWETNIITGNNHSSDALRSYISPRCPRMLPFSGCQWASICILHWSHVWHWWWYRCLHFPPSPLHPLETLQRISLDGLVHAEPHKCRRFLGTSEKPVPWDESWSWWGLDYHLPHISGSHCLLLQEGPRRWPGAQHSQWNLKRKRRNVRKTSELKLNN